MKGNQADFGSTSAPSGRQLKSTDEVRFTPTLVCYTGAQRGQTFPLAKMETVVGRGTEANISLLDEHASRRHFRVLYKNWIEPADRPQCFIEDLGSSNGTTVNGEPLTKRVQLMEHDRIHVGSTVFGFVTKDEREFNLNKSLFEHATKDSLTKLDNRRRFESQLGLQLVESRQARHSIAVLVIDADRFKLVNDTYGHDAGDMVLVHLANVIRSCCRGSEVCARWGGEEFVMLLPDCTLDGAKTAAERIRLKIEAVPVQAGDHSLHLTVSIGGTTIATHETFEAAFRRADQQLLRAKTEGRNRAYIVDPEAERSTV